MTGNNHKQRGLGAILGRIGSTALRAVNTRVELLTIEWQEERLRLRDMLVWGVAFLFLVLMAALLITATIIFLFPPEYRVAVTGVIGLLYLAGAIVAWSRLRGGMKREPFADSIEQVKKDRLWLESLK
jgi:uncharacterized membrane protein YqjE